MPNHTLPRAPVLGFLCAQRLVLLLQLTPDALPPLLVQLDEPGQFTHFLIGCGTAVRQLDRPVVGLPVLRQRLPVILDALEKVQAAAGQEGKAVRVVLAGMIQQRPGSTPPQLIPPPLTIVKNTDAGFNVGLRGNIPGNQHNFRCDDDGAGRLVPAARADQPYAGDIAVRVVIDDEELKDIMVLSREAADGPVVFELDMQRASGALPAAFIERGGAGAAH